VQVAQAGANLGSDAIQGELNLYQGMLPAGVVTKAEQAAAQAIADTGEEGFLSKLWNKCLGKNTPHFHHPWPKYLGGNPDQILEPLPNALHDAYHAGLDQVLGRWNGSDYFPSLPADDQAQVLQALKNYTQGFDAKYGTHLYDAMVREGFPH